MKHRRLIKTIAVLILTLAMILPTISASAITVTPDANYRFYYVGNAHIDTSWTWPFQHTAEVVVRDTWNRQVSALNSNATYRFTMSAASHYLWLKEYYDTDTNTNTTYRTFWNETSKFIANGQWGIAGGQMVEPDLNLTGGEAYARHGLYAQHIFLGFFGKMATVAYVPDVFGFSGQFPQFIRKTGMQSFIATKLNWRSDPASGALDPGPWAEASSGGGSAAKGRESDLFWWEAIDGSDVLAYNCYNDYTSSYSTNDFTGSGNTVFNRLRNSGNITAGGTSYPYDYDSGIRYAVAMFGSGDHGGGPNTGTSAGQHGFAGANNANATGRSSALASTIEQYFDDLRLDSANVTPGVGLSKVYRHRGENYLSYHRGTYTSWSRVKKYNRQNEIFAEVAEKAATLGYWVNALDNNGSDKVAIAWDRILINQMHDVLPGSAAPYQYYQTFMNQELVKNLMTSLETNSLLALAHRADTTVDEGIPVFVYNPSSWKRTGETTTSVKLDRRYSYIKVFDGTDELPVTIIDNKLSGAAKISFIAKDVPSLGYKVFKVVGSDTAPAFATDLTFSESSTLFTIGNSNLEFTISKTTGNMPSLINKKDNNRQIFYQNAAFQGNSLQFKVDTGGGSYPAWDMTNNEFGGVTQSFTTVNTAQAVTVVENTKERITIKVIQAISDSPTTKPSTATRYITLLAGSDKIDVKFELDWQMVQRNLKLAFPTNVDAKAVSGEIAYGAMDAGSELTRLAQTQYGPYGGPGALGRSTMRDTRWNGARFEQSAHKWFDVSDDSAFTGSGGSGLSILNDAKYGYDVLRMVRTTTSGCGVDSGISGSDTYVRQRLTVVRSPNSAGETQETTRYTPTSQVIDIGYQEFNYAIYPHAGTWKTAETSTKAHELCYPMPSFQAVPGAGDSILGKEHSFFTTDKANVKIGAVKNMHDNQADNNTFIVRLWESNGADTANVTLTMPSNVLSVKEVNMLEHDYNALDNRDVPVAKALVAKDFTGKVSGKNISFDIGHYEVLTLQVQVAPYAGAPVVLRQQVVPLSGLYNLKGTTTDAARTASSIDGAGNSIPEKLWSAARAKRVDYQGVKFDLAAENASNFVTAQGQTIPISAAGMNKVFLLGVSAGTGIKGGKFTVNYSDGETAEKAITFADWKSPLTGWVPLDKMDTNPYVYDSIAQVFTHWHSGTRDEMTLDNFLFVYYIDLDEAKTISSITLPDASGIKIAAISLANSPIEGFGFTNDVPFETDEELYWNFSDSYAGFAIGTNIDKLNIRGDMEATGSRAFSALNSAGTTTTGTEGASQIVTNNGSSKWCNTGTNANNAWFIMDAGAAYNLPGYVIRGANDDMSYTGRVLDSWIVQGGNSASGPWTTISSPSGQGSGWTANYQTRLYLFDAGVIPSGGYRYYRLQITRIGTGGSALGTSSTTVQFSYFGLITGYGFRADGALSVNVETDASKVGNDITISTVNGPNVITVSGPVAGTGSAPLATRNYATIRKGLNVKVYSDTKLAYMFKPKDNVSAHMAFDVRFADGTRLKDLGAVDQYGIVADPKAQGDGLKLIAGKWNYVEIDLGASAEGKIINEIIVGFEADSVTPGYEVFGAFDNIMIFRDGWVSEDVNVYAALYNARGYMVDVSISDTLSTKAFNVVLFDPAIVFDATPAGAGCYVKAFIWDEDYIPITESTTFSF